MTDRELMQQALEALEYAADHIGCPDDDDAIGVARKALRERLSESVAQPVAWMVWDDNNVPSLTFTKPADKYVFDALYISPQPASKPWVGLTDEEIDDIYQGAGKNDLKRARAIEAKLKEKNA